MKLWVIIVIFLPELPFYVLSRQESHFLGLVFGDFLLCGQLLVIVSYERVVTVVDNLTAGSLVVGRSEFRSSQLLYELLVAYVSLLAIIIAENMFIMFELVHDWAM